MTSRDPRRPRERHALDADGMVLCNPRDREAAHRAEVGDLATADLADVTCARCRVLAHRARRDPPA